MSITRLHCLGFVALLFPPVLAVLTAAPTPEIQQETNLKELLTEHVKRLPLRFEKSVQAREMDWPLATVGSFPEEEWARLPKDGKTSKAGAVINGLVTLQPLRAGQRADVCLVGPSLNSGESWVPSLVLRRDNVITVVMESWTDNGLREKNIPSQDAYLLSLGGPGALKAGDYDLRIISRVLFRDIQNESLFYEYKKVRIGKLKFQVVGTREAAPKLAKLQPGELKQVEVTPEERQWLRQRPTDLTQLDLRPDRPPPEGTGMEVRAGWFNREEWLKTPPRRTADMPVLADTAGKGLLYAAALGPALNSGDYTSLREIAYKGKQVVLRMDVWRDAGERRRNIIQQPLLVAPLLVSVPGDYRVEVEWTFLRGANHEGPFTREMSKTSEARFKID
jgi:hypothetical protein